MKSWSNSNVRRWIDRVYDFDERLHERAEASRGLVLINLGLVWALSLAMAAMIWFKPLADVDTRLVCIGIALLPGSVATWFARLRLRAQLLEERRKLGRCLACGYDLRATPDLCPECGTACR